MNITKETDMVIEALKAFAFAHLVPLIVTAFVLIAAFAAAFTFYPPAVPVLFNGVLNRIAYLLQVPGLYAVSFGMVEAQSPLGAFMLCSGILLIPTLIFAILFLHLSKRRLKDA